MIHPRIRQESQMDQPHSAANREQVAKQIRLYHCRPVKIYYEQMIHLY